MAAGISSVQLHMTGPHSVRHYEALIVSAACHTMREQTPGHTQLEHENGTLGLCKTFGLSLILKPKYTHFNP